MSEWRHSVGNTWGTLRETPQTGCLFALRDLLACRARRGAPRRRGRGLLLRDLWAQRRSRRRIASHRVMLRGCHATANDTQQERAQSERARVEAYVRETLAMEAAALAQLTAEWTDRVSRNSARIERFFKALQDDVAGEFEALTTITNGDLTATKDGTVQEERFEATLVEALRAEGERHGGDTDERPGARVACVVPILAQR